MALGATFLVICALGLVAAGMSLRNAVRRYKDVGRTVDLRRTLPQRSERDPLAIFTPQEVSLLTVSPDRSSVRGTRFFGLRCPDPWAGDFAVEQHLWAVYANRLHDMASVGAVVVEVVIVLAGGFIGVVLTRIIEPSTGVKTSDGPVVALVLALFVVSLSALLRVTMLQTWQKAAEQYRYLSRRQLEKRGLGTSDNEIFIRSALDGVSHEGAIE